MTQNNDSVDGPNSDDAQANNAALIADADHAWKLLALVNEWIRHADAKATAGLAFTGALGTLLYNLVKNQSDAGIALNTFTVLAVISLGFALLFCGLTLTPRIKVSDANPESINKIFFASIAENYKDGQLEYRDVLKTLTEDPAALISDLADQIHANAEIATIKSRHTQYAIRFVLGAGVLIGAVAALVAN
ncbi:Pycsar system effector family protein [Rhodococcus qingshengii]|uniref:Pycsar system effector family protein n=1 Tax=Rhodococcus qingshengii TaxID=334542 RepID=UPI0037C95183